MVVVEAAAAGHTCAGIDPSQGGQLRAQRFRAIVGRGRSQGDDGLRR